MLPWHTPASCAIDSVLYGCGMKLSDEALDEFMRIYMEEFGEEITKAEASETASRVVTLYELLTRKLPGEQKPSEPKPPTEEGPPRKIGFQI